MTHVPQQEKAEEVEEAEEAEEERCEGAAAGAPGLRRELYVIAAVFVGASALVAWRLGDAIGFLAAPITRALVHAPAPVAMHAAELMDFLLVLRVSSFLGALLAAPLLLRAGWRVLGQNRKAPGHLTLIGTAALWGGAAAGWLAATPLFASTLPSLSHTSAACSGDFAFIPLRAALGFVTLTMHLGALALWAPLSFAGLTALERIDRAAIIALTRPAFIACAAAGFILSPSRGLTTWLLVTGCLLVIWLACVTTVFACTSKPCIARRTQP